MEVLNSTIIFAQVVGEALVNRLKLWRCSPIGSREWRQRRI